MPRITELGVPRGFSFRHTVQSHGWYDLPPFEHSDGSSKLIYVFAPSGEDGAVTASVQPSRNKLNVELSSVPRNGELIEKGIRHMLRLDDDMREFYSTLKQDKRLAWVAEVNAGRLLRSSTVWEDLVKTICTTNCSWALTRKMVSNLVNKLGDAASDGRHAFPSPTAMAEQDEAFYRDEIRAGYRSPYFVELAESVASGKIDPGSWANSGMPTPELKKELKRVKGVGDYAAENLLKLLGRYDGLALDSWLRAKFYKTHNRGRKCADKKIDKFYSKFGRWKALALWCDMTESWFR
jgi:N-glycosylase/DNA lyase